MSEAVSLDELIVQQAPDALVCTDAGGRIVRWNAAAEVLFGYAASQALGQSLDLIIPERLRAPHWAGFARAVADGRTQHHGQAVTTAAIRKDGTRIHAEMSFGLVSTPDGKVAGALAIARPKAATP